ncbi:MAG: hypothetical protein H7122_03940 [Chitinophagaceae bacterium]|nr:hypothetical protein [Chitinophagaceae bacterium]
MKPETVEQEVLLLATSTFSKRQFCEIDTQPGEQTNLNPREYLEKSCWNGLLISLLPDIIKSNNDLFVWKVENHQFFLRISLGSRPPEIESRFSLDPDSFLPYKQMN